MRLTPLLFLVFGFVFVSQSQTSADQYFHKSYVFKVDTKGKAELDLFKSNNMGSLFFGNQKGETSSKIKSSTNILPIGLLKSAPEIDLNMLLFLSDVKPFDHSKCDKIRVNKDKENKIKMLISGDFRKKTVLKAWKFQLDERDLINKDLIQKFLNRFRPKRKNALIELFPEVVAVTINIGTVKNSKLYLESNFDFETAYALDITKPLLPKKINLYQSLDKRSVHGYLVNDILLDPALTDIQIIVYFNRERYFERTRQPLRLSIEVIEESESEVQENYDSITLHPSAPPEYIDASVATKRAAMGFDLIPPLRMASIRQGQLVFAIDPRCTYDDAWLPASRKSEHEIALVALSDPIDVNF